MYKHHLQSETGREMVFLFFEQIFLKSLSGTNEERVISRESAPPPLLLGTAPDAWGMNVRDLTLCSFSVLPDLGERVLATTRITHSASLAFCLPLHFPVPMQVGPYECDGWIQLHHGGRSRLPGPSMLPYLPELPCKNHRANSWAVLYSTLISWIQDTEQIMTVLTPSKVQLVLYGESSLLFFKMTRARQKYKLQRERRI